mgnify:CR=1 FL=1
MGMNMVEFMQACSDLETDDGKKEVDTPWPTFMKEEIWADRVNLRKGMKTTMPTYKARSSSLPDILQFVLSLPAKEKRRIFQIPRDEVSEILKSKYSIGGAYLVVLCAVVEQVANFNVTGYKLDGRGETEVDFENVVDFDKRGGFTLTNDGIFDVESDSVLDESIKTFFAFLPRLGGPKLMPRSKKTEEAEENDDEEAKEEVEPETVTGVRGQSFRADRRLCRLLLARYWADSIFKKFDRRGGENKDEEEGEGEGENEIDAKIDLDLKGLEKLNIQHAERKKAEAKQEENLFRQV